MNQVRVATKMMKVETVPSSPVLGTYRRTGFNCVV